MWELTFQPCRDESNQIYWLLWPSLKLISSRGRTHLAVYFFTCHNFNQSKSQSGQKNTHKLQFENTVTTDTISRLWAQSSAEDDRIEIFETKSTSFQRLVAWFDAYTHESGSRWMYKWWALVNVVCINQSLLFFVHKNTTHFSWFKIIY